MEPTPPLRITRSLQTSICSRPEMLTVRFTFLEVSDRQEATKMSQVQVSTRLTTRQYRGSLQRSQFIPECTISMTQLHGLRRPIVRDQALTNLLALTRRANTSPQTFSKRSFAVNYCCSNSKASMWSPVKSRRFLKDLSSNLMNPPPGTYNPSDQQSRSGYGNYILSNFKTFGTTKIVPISGKGAHDGLFSRQSKDLFILLNHFCSNTWSRQLHFTQ